VRRLRKRPLSIRLFVVCFLLSALIAFVDGLRDWQGLAAVMRVHLPELDWSWDAVVVLLSARLSIAAIPVTLVWFLASRFAQWLVTIMVLGKLINVPEAVALVRRGSQLDPMWAASLVLSLIAVLMLFMPASREWFRTKGEDRVAVFS
jgi:hypothetical protein